MGGNGYVEEEFSRHYRESPVNAGSYVPTRCGAVARGGGCERCAANAGVAEKGLPGRARAIAFIAKSFRSPDASGVARSLLKTVAGRRRRCIERNSQQHAELFALTRLNGAHGNMYGAVDLAPEQRQTRRSRVACRRNLK